MQQSSVCLEIWKLLRTRIVTPDGQVIRRYCHLAGNPQHYPCMPLKSLVLELFLNYWVYLRTGN